MINYKYFFAIFSHYQLTTLRFIITISIINNINGSAILNNISNKLIKFHSLIESELVSGFLHLGFINKFFCQFSNFIN